MTNADTLYFAPPRASRAQNISLIVGVLSLSLCLVGAFLRPTQFLQAYLFGYLFVSGIALGCLGLVMMQYLTGGDWGVVIRRVLESATRTMPLLAVMFLPIALGLHKLYVWSRPPVPGAEPLDFQEKYLNVPFFIARAVVYFAVWITYAYLLNKWSRAQDHEENPRILRCLRFLSGPGLVVYGVTVTFAAFDWVMSLNPEWYSTIFGLLIIGGQALTATAFVIGVAALLSRTEPMASVYQPRHFHDLGKLLLAFVMVWAYFSFSQLLIVWAGNLPEEIPFYVPRMQTSWKWVGVLLIVFQFALPFALLLSRTLKRQAMWLAGIAALVIALRLVDLFWLVAPQFHEEGVTVHWLDVLTLVGLSGVWLAFFLWQLRARPLLPLHDPNLAAALGPEKQYSVNRRE